MLCTNLNVLLKLIIILEHKVAPKIEFDMLSRIISKLLLSKTSLINNENKNRLINLDLLDTYTKQRDFTLLDAGCGNGTNLEDIILKYPDAKIIGIDNFKTGYRDAKKVR